MAPSRITVLISGNGSNLQAIIDACQDGTIPNASVVRVVHNILKAYGAVRAKNANIPTTYHNLKKYEKELPDTPEGRENAREAFYKDLAPILLDDKPDIVVCAGWMLIVTSSFLDSLASSAVPIINLHPALYGAFPGKNAIKQAYDAFHRGEVKKTGIMIHYVIKEVDAGSPIVTRELEIREGETLEDLETRIHQLEWPAIVEGTKIAIEKVLLDREETKGS